MGSHDRPHRSVDISFSGAPTRDGDAHVPAALPGRPSHPALAGPLYGSDNPVGGRVIISEAHQDLVEDHVVTDLNGFDGSKLVGEPPGQQAAALNELGDPPTTEFSHGGPGRQTPGPPGGLRHIVTR